MGSVNHNGKKIEVADGESIQDACEEFGLEFACGEGICGTCECEVKSGMDNLNEMTEEEEDYGCDGNQRLACMCKLKSGDIEIDF